MEEVVAHAKRGGLVIGICNGFQMLCAKWGSCPAPSCSNQTLTFLCQDVVPPGAKPRTRP